MRLTIWSTAFRLFPGIFHLLRRIQTLLSALHNSMAITQVTTAVPYSNLSQPDFLLEKAKMQTSAGVMS